jgi:multidrug efflux system outer membrane protein
MRRLLGYAAGLSLAGCSLAPPYSIPPSPTAPAYKEQGPWQAAATEVEAPGAWWTAFGDTTLDGLETRIEAANPDLAAAVARYDQARGLLGESRAARLPSIS